MTTVEILARRTTISMGNRKTSSKWKMSHAFWKIVEIDFFFPQYAFRTLLTEKLASTLSLYNALANLRWLSHISQIRKCKTVKRQLAFSFRAILLLVQIVNYSAKSCPARIGIISKPRNYIRPSSRVVCHILLTTNNWKVDMFTSSQD